MRRRNPSVRHWLTSKVFFGGDAGVLCHKQIPDCYPHRYTEGVLIFSAIHGKAIPDTIDRAGIQLHILRIPVDGLFYQCPAESVTDLLCHIADQNRQYSPTIILVAEGGNSASKPTTNYIRPLSVHLSPVFDLYRAFCCFCLLVLSAVGAVLSAGAASAAVLPQPTIHSAITPAITITDNFFITHSPVSLVIHQFTTLNCCWDYPNIGNELCQLDFLLFLSYIFLRFCLFFFLFSEFFFLSLVPEL